MFRQWLFPEGDLHLTNIMETLQLIQHFPKPGFGKQIGCISSLETFHPGLISSSLVTLYIGGISFSLETFHPGCISSSLEILHSPWAEVFGEFHIVGLWGTQILQSSWAVTSSHSRDKWNIPGMVQECLPKKTQKLFNVQWGRQLPIQKLKLWTSPKSETLHMARIPPVKNSTAQTLIFTWNYL